MFKHATANPISLFRLCASGECTVSLRTLTPSSPTIVGGTLECSAGSTTQWHDDGAELHVTCAPEQAQTFVFREPMLGKITAAGYTFVNGRCTERPPRAPCRLVKFRGPALCAIDARDTCTVEIGNDAPLASAVHVIARDACTVTLNAPINVRSVTVEASGRATVHINNVARSSVTVRTHAPGASVRIGPWLYSSP